MAFDIKNFGITSDASTGNLPQNYTFYTNVDSAEDAITDGYFNEISDRVEVGDYIYAVMSDGAHGLWITSDNGVIPVTAEPVLTLSNYYIYRVAQASFAGGSTTLVITSTGIVSTDLVFTSITASTNGCVIEKSVPTTDTITIEFNIDPGAATVVNYQVLRLP